MQDDVTRGRFVEIGELLQSDIIPIGASKRQRSQFAHAAPVVWDKNDRYVENSVSFVNLSYRLSSIRASNDIKNLKWVEAPAHHIILSKAHYNLRHAGRRLDLDLSRATDTAQHRSNFPCFLVQLLSVVAETIDHNRGP